MNCFNHPETVAVAGCRHCGKALCQQCSREGVGGISCGDACAAEVNAAHDMAKYHQKSVDDTKKLIKELRKSNRGIYWALSGIVVGLLAAWAAALIFVAWRASKGEL